MPEHTSKRPLIAEFHRINEPTRKWISSLFSAVSIAWTPAFRETLGTRAMTKLKLSRAIIAISAITDRQFLNMALDYFNCDATFAFDNSPEEHVGKWEDPPEAITVSKEERIALQLETASSIWRRYMAYAYTGTEPEKGPKSMWLKRIAEDSRKVTSTMVYGGSDFEVINEFVAPIYCLLHRLKLAEQNSTIMRETSDIISVAYAFASLLNTIDKLNTVDSAAFVKTHARDGGLCTLESNEIADLAECIGIYDSKPKSKFKLVLTGNTELLAYLGNEVQFSLKLPEAILTTLSEQGKLCD